MVAVKYGRQLEVTPEPPFLEQEPVRPRPVAGTKAATLLAWSPPCWKIAGVEYQYTRINASTQDKDVTPPPWEAGRPIQPAVRRALDRLLPASRNDV